MDEIIFAAVKSEPGTNSAVAVPEPVDEPCSFAVKPVGEAWFDAAVRSWDESCFAAAVVPVGEPCPVSGQQVERGPVSEL